MKVSISQTAQNRIEKAIKGTTLGSLKTFVSHPKYNLVIDRTSIGEPITKEGLRKYLTKLEQQREKVRDI